MANRRVGGVAAILLAALVLQTWSASWAQNAVKPAPPPPAVAPVPAPAFPPPADKDKTEFTDRVKLHTDHTMTRRFEEVHRLVKEGDWKEAFRLLQERMLDASQGKEDAFVELTDEQNRPYFVSVRTQANKIIGDLPPEGLQFYELHYGVQARTRLDEGKAAGDPKIYAEVAVRYMHTEAGIEAAALWGTWDLDHGRYTAAAGRFERLLEREGLLDKVPPQLLVKAAFAFERAGATEKRKKIWDALDAKVRGNPLTIGGKRMTLAELEKIVTAKGPEVVAGDPFGWPVFQGGPARNGRGDGSAPFLVSRWVWPDPIKAKAKNDPSYSLYASPETIGWLKRAADKQGERSPIPVFSGFHPIVTGNKLVFRSYWGVHAVNLKDNKADETRAGDLAWHSRFHGSLDYIIEHQGRFFPQHQPFATWMTQYVTYGPTVFTDHSVLGTLSSDGVRVYAVDDLTLPPYTAMMNNFGLRFFHEEMNRWLNHNRLMAIDLESGNVVWEIGAQSGEKYADTFFLAPPLPVGEYVYALVETKQEIRLLCMDPNQLEAVDPEGKVKVPALIWAQTLCQPERKLLDEGARRTQAASLAYADGMLICPTNAGVILGVDLLNRSLVWAHSYQEGDEGVRLRPGQPGFNYQMQFQIPTSHWAATAPVIADGKVVFTSPDAPTIQCLDLRDGKLLWTRRKEDGDFYLGGVFGGKVLLVGKNQVRALDLKDGSKEVWRSTEATGTPTGRGIATKTHYFVPVKRKDGTQEVGEVWSVNLENGKVAKSHAPKPRKNEVAETKDRNLIPGNLVLFESDVISQNQAGVAAYPMLAVVEREITAKLDDNPNDAEARAKRGKLRYHQGEYLSAVEDFHVALDSNPPPELRDDVGKYLYDALGDLLDDDFGKHEKFVAEFEKLTHVPDADEKLSRRANYLRLLAKGREGQGRLTDAYQAYSEFAALGVKQLLHAPDSPSTKVLPAVWAQARMAEMVKKATPDQRSQLAAAFQKQWEKVQTGADLDALRGFVDAFGSVSEQGMQARLQLALRLMGDSTQILEGELFGEAESQLIYLARNASPELAAKGLDTLAQLYTRKRFMEDAFESYRQLARRFPKVVVRDGKTAEEIFNGLSADKRFWPYLDERRGTSWNGTGDFKQYIVRVNNVQPNQQQNQMMVIPLDPETESLPYFDRFRLTIYQNYQTREAKLVDKMTGEVKPAFRLEQRPEIVWNIQFGQQRIRGACKTAGHLMVFSWGHHVYGYDPLRNKVLWNRDLLEGLDIRAQNAAGVNTYLQPQPNGSLVLMHPDGFMEKLGLLGPVEPTYACFVVRGKGLVCLDPWTGRERWIKSDVPPGTEMFGDGDYIYLAQPNRNQGTYTTLALQALSGVPVQVPDFNALYREKRGVFGRHLLLRDIGANGVTLRLYDVQTGADAWARNFGPKAVALNSQVLDLVGAIDAEGKAVVLDAGSGREVLKAALDPALVANSPEVHLLADARTIFLAFNLPSNANVPANQARRQVSAYGLRHVPIQGPLYAFDRATGQERWQPVDMPQQHLIVERFDESPLLICASRQIVWQNAGQPGAPPLPPRTEDTVLAIDKRTGKPVPNDSENAMPARSQLTTIYEVRVDAKTGTTDLVCPYHTVVFSTTPPDGSGGAAVNDPNAPFNPRLPRPIMPVPVVPGGPIQIQPVIQPVPEAVPVDVPK